MAIMATTTMNAGGRHGADDHENDVVMPGFRFHPTEEELIEFYLRRKVEGKRFNVELITFLDLYRYDPWELPALAAIGEKEWFFYVPRDRKYRNGDRPNRVTRSGYWKATGADRVIRGEDSRSIGLKKTLVFYSGKAPKGIRTSWIMNEYRLPQSETDRHQKSEISLCRVYKRAGIENHHQLPGTVPNNRPSSSRQTATAAAARRTSMSNYKNLGGGDSSPSSSSIGREDDAGSRLSSDTLGSLLLNAASVDHVTTVGELSRFVSYNQSQLLHPFPPQAQLLPLNMVPAAAASDKLWEWNILPESSGKDYSGFK
ncbi:NAC domain-containing protein 35-like [Iris pallida]|uniref:NAC domain-containing protein 35-like n=1 Tax=Iris pallida TaxID=29817 RepID=A0AAX6E345_IRIPA|nr:NAC domain-containing protein 35-like [Iris pallida]